MNGSKTNTKKTNMFGTIKIELIILPVATHHNLITRPKNFPKEELSWYKGLPMFRALGSALVWFNKEENLSTTKSLKKPNTKIW